jgi:hypothetical protein
MFKHRFSVSLLVLALVGSSVLSASVEARGKTNGFNYYDWTEVNEQAPWVAVPACLPIQVPLISPCFSPRVKLCINIIINNGCTV